MRLAWRYKKSLTVQMTMRLAVIQSGRPDLNRGPPAPKAGAIPGYATPRSEGKLLYPAFGAQRAQQRAECTAAMTFGCRILD